MQGKDDDNNANEGTATSGEEIDKPNKDTERNYNVSDGDENVDWDAGADKYKSDGSDGDKNEYLH